MKLKQSLQRVCSIGVARWHENEDMPPRYTKDNLMKKIESYAQKIIDKNVNMTVPYYIMASYAYYVENSPIFSDSFFEDMAKKMLTDWDIIDHFHKEYVSVDELVARTYLGHYPNRIKSALHNLREQTLED